MNGLGVYYIEDSVALNIKLMTLPQHRNRISKDIPKTRRFEGSCAAMCRVYQSGSSLRNRIERRRGAKIVSQSAGRRIRDAAASAPAVESGPGSVT